MRPKDMSKKKRKRRNFKDEYKAEVVRLCQQPGKTPNGVAVELGLTPSAVMGWVKQATVDAGGGGDGALTTAEREELSALRKEIKQQATAPGARDFEAGHCFFREGGHVVTADVHLLAAETKTSVAAGCRALELPRSSVYARRNRPLSRRAHDTALLDVEVAAVHEGQQTAVRQSTCSSRPSTGRSSREPQAHRGANASTGVAVEASQALSAHDPGQ